LGAMSDCFENITESLFKLEEATSFWQDTMSNGNIASDFFIINYFGILKMEYNFQFINES
jgi:hypothetical protein